MALLRVLDDLYSSIDDGRSTVLVSLDISDAFDIVWHELLVCKMISVSLESQSTGCAVSSLRSAVIDHREFRVVQASHKALPSDHSFSPSTCRRLQTSLLNMESGSINLLTTCKLTSLDAVLDSHLTYEKQVQSIYKSFNYHLWASRHIRHFVLQDIAHTLVCSIVMSRMDYCNALLIGAPEYVISRLQRVLARIVTGSSHRTPAVPLLSIFHCLPVRHRMEYKLALITYKVRCYIKSRLLKRSTHVGCQDRILAAFLLTSIANRPSNKNC